MAKYEGLYWHIVVYVIVAAVGITMFIPFVWMVLTAFKPPEEIFLYPPTLLPTRLRFQNFPEAWNIIPFGRYYLNTIFITLTVTGTSLLLNSLAGFAFARYRFPGRNLLFAYILSTMMMPIYVTMIPTFLILKFFGWLDTFRGLIVPFCASAFGIFFMRQFFQTMPEDLFDSARIDGASELKLFVRIALPLAKPAIGALTIFTFMGTWNNFLWPLIVIMDEMMFTLTLAIAHISLEGNVIKWNYLMAGATFVTTPVLIVFLINQRFFIKGITLSGLKL